jgi:hypothetical protein
MLRTTLCLFLLLVLPACDDYRREANVAAAAQDASGDLAKLSPLFTVRDLEMPESFQYDATSKKYFISNIVTAPPKSERNGYISRLNEQGEMDIQQFIVDLDSPSGIAFWQNNLYVCDGDTIKGFVPATAQKIFSYSLSSLGAKGLNDLVAAPDCLYISATFDNLIFRLVPNVSDAGKSQAQVFCRDTLLALPNGVALDPLSGLLTVVCWQSGEVLTISADGKASRKWERQFTNPDGIAFDKKGNLYLSSFGTGTIYRITPQGEATVVSDKLAAPADISLGADEKSLLVPCYKGNYALALPVK